MLAQSGNRETQEKFLLIDNQSEVTYFTQKGLIHLDDERRVERVSAKYGVYWRDLASCLSDGHAVGSVLVADIANVVLQFADMVFWAWGGTRNKLMVFFGVCVSVGDFCTGEGAEKFGGTN
jgi:hypothetical protein